MGILGFLKDVMIGSNPYDQSKSAKRNKIERTLPKCKETKRRRKTSRAAS